MTEQEAIKNLQEITLHDLEHKEAFMVAINSLELVSELKARNITINDCENYMQFEDELVSKGYTFKSLLNARDRDEARKPFAKQSSEDWRCPRCHSEVYPNSGIKMGYCMCCGQALKWF